MTGGWRWEVNVTVVADSTVLHFPSSACLTQVFTSCIPWAFVVPCAFVHAPFLTVFMVTRCSCLVSRCLTAPFLFVPACVSVKIPPCVSKFVYVSCIWVQLFYSSVTQLLIQVLSALQFQFHCSTELYTSLAAEYFTVLLQNTTSHHFYLDGKKSENKEKWGIFKLRQWNVCLIPHILLLCLVLLFGA